jgi:hypothetical protein
METIVRSAPARYTIEPEIFHQCIVSMLAAIFLPVMAGDRVISGELARVPD